MFLLLPVLNIIFLFGYSVFLMFKKGEFMNLERLKEFTVIAEHQNLSAAASILGISTATLSARLKTFENDLGCQLFLRENNRLTLSPTGNRFLVDAQEIVSDFQSLKNTLVNITGTYAYSRLRIAILGAGMPPHLGPFLDQLNKQYPNLHLQLLDDSVFSIRDGILNEQVDIYFAPAMPDINYEGIGKLHISPCRCHLIVPKDHHLGKLSTISLNDLDGETFILYPQTAESVLRDYQLHCLSASKIHYQLYEDNCSPLFYHLLVPIGKGLLLTPSLDVKLPPNAVSLNVTDAPFPIYESLFYNKVNTPPEVSSFLKEYRKFSKEATQYGHRTTF